MYTIRPITMTPILELPFYLNLSRTHFTLEKNIPEELIPLRINNYLLSQGFDITFNNKCNRWELSQYIELCVWKTDGNIVVEMRNVGNDPNFYQYFHHIRSYMTSEEMNTQDALSTRAHLPIGSGERS